jgi:hypothetical protein
VNAVLFTGVVLPKICGIADMVRNVVVLVPPNASVQW